MTRLFLSFVVLGLLGCQPRSSYDHSYVSYDVSPNGEQIVFSSASGDLFLLDVSTHQVEQLTETPEIDTTPEFSPDGSFILFTSATPGHGTSHIIRLGVQDKQVEQLTSDGNVYDLSPRCSLDGSKIVFSRAHRYRDYSMGGKTWDDWDIYVMDVDGNNVRRVTNQKYRGISSPRLGVDGKTIFFSSRVKRQGFSFYSATFMVSMSDEQPPKNLTPDDQNLIGCAALGSSPAVSPDGTKMVFISDRKTEYEYDLWLMNIDGSNPTSLNLTSVSKYNAIPKFSPDGKKVFFLAESEKNVSSRSLYSLWTAEVTGKNPRRIASMDLFNTPLQWDPDNDGVEE